MEPREEKSSTGWRIAIGCSVALLVALIAGGIACGLVCRHMTARRPIARDTAVMTGRESGHGWLYVTASDPGMVAIRRYLEGGIQRVTEKGKRPRARAHFAGGEAMFLPARLQVRVYPPASPGGDVSLVGELELSGGYNLLATALRFVGRERRERLGSGASLYRFPEREGDRELCLGVTGSRFVLSRSRDAVVPLVDGSHPLAPLRPPAALAGVVAAAHLQTEDAAAWATGGADLGLGWMHFGAVSADLVTEDQVDFRAAFDVPPDLPREEGAKRVEDWIRARVQGELEVHLGEPEWLDAHTVRYAGTVTGIAALLDRLVVRTLDGQEK